MRFTDFFVVFDLKLFIVFEMRNDPTGGTGTGKNGRSEKLLF